MMRDCLRIESKFPHFLTSSKIIVFIDGVGKQELCLANGRIDFALFDRTYDDGAILRFESHDAACRDARRLTKRRRKRNVTPLTDGYSFDRGHTAVSNGTNFCC